MKLSSRIKLLAEAEEVLNTMRAPIKEQSLNKGTLVATLTTYDEYVTYMKKVKSLQAKMTKTFNQEIRKYLTGKWDIIHARGAQRWGDSRKTMDNDIINFYNASIKSAQLDFYRDQKTGILIPSVFITADGDNVEGEQFVRLASLEFYKGYQSPEGKEYKQGY